eukprot:TRINITY_DN2655_c1_g2_i1.p1 TRINITY_DN2655_c1_g2~~TRINITY_DN2655_c1_g2_i1.p1  ORF type:complete len:199 (-),score=66.47 TRINITY_DN2655_c1_g2_i1:88-621(-)
MEEANGSQDTVTIEAGQATMASNPTAVGTIVFAVHSDAPVSYVQAQPHPSIVNVPLRASQMQMVDDVEEEEGEEEEPIFEESVEPALADAIVGEAEGEEEAQDMQWYAQVAEEDEGDAGLQSTETNEDGAVEEVSENEGEEEEAELDGDVDVEDEQPYTNYQEEEYYDPLFTDTLAS